MSTLLSTWCTKLSHICGCRVSFEFQHNVCGRSIYAEGTVDAAMFLYTKVWIPNTDSLIFGCSQLLSVEIDSTLIADTIWSEQETLWHDWCLERGQHEMRSMECLCGTYSQLKFHHGFGFLFFARSFCVRHLSVLGYQLFAGNKSYWLRLNKWLFVIRWFFQGTKPGIAAPACHATCSFLLDVALKSRGFSGYPLSTVQPQVPLPIVV